jgi:MFS family permease
MMTDTAITDVDGAPVAPIRRTAWGAILVLALAVCAGATMRTVFSPLQEAAKASMGLTDVQMSLVQGLAMAAPMALIALPLGWLADRTNRLRILLVLSGLWTVGMAMTAFAQDFTVLFLARMLAGTAGNFVVPVAISVAADLCMPERRGRSLLLLSLGNVVGAALAFAIGGVVLGAAVEQHTPALFGLEPWRETSLWFAIASAVLTLPLLALREPARHEVEQADAPIRAIASALWSRRGFLVPLFIGQVGVVMADMAATVWAAPVLERDYGLSPVEFGSWMGGGLLLAGIVGSIIGGFSADWGQKLTRRGGILTGAVIAAVLAVPASLYPIMPSTALFGVAFTLLMICGTVAGLITATAIAVLVPNEERGLCLGAFMILGALIGIGIAPLVVTLTSQAMGGESQLALSLAVTSVIIGVLSFGGFWLAMKNAPRPPEEAV